MRTKSILQFYNPARPVSRPRNHTHDSTGSRAFEIDTAYQR